MIKQFALECTVPRRERCIQQLDGTNYVGNGKLCGIVKGAIDVRFSREVNDAVDLIALEHIGQKANIQDIAFFKVIVGQTFYITQVFKIAGVRQFVEIDDCV